MKYSDRQIEMNTNDEEPLENDIEINNMENKNEGNKNVKQSGFFVHS